MEYLPSYTTTEGPLVSIIIPTYNVAPYLERCLLSIQRQTYRNFEVIIMDDCSSDDSFKIAKEMERTDHRFHSYRMPDNSGAGDTRQAAIDLSKGDIIGFVDGDDWIDDSYLAVLYGLMKTTDTDVACCQQYFYDDVTGDINTPWPYNSKTRVLPVTEAMLKMKFYDLMDESLWNKLYKRKVITSHKMITSPFEDALILYKYFSGIKNVALCSLPLYYYYQRDGSLMHTQYTPYKEFVRFKLEIMKDRAIARSERLSTRVARRHIAKGLKMLREFCLLEQTPEITKLCEDVVEWIHEFDYIKNKRLPLNILIARTIAYHNLALYLRINRKYAEKYRKKKIKKVQHKYSVLTMDVFQQGL